MNNLPNISFVGRSISRREDRRLLTGRGQFIADLQLPQMLHAAFVRSPLAHARIKAIDLSRAAASPGIICALSGPELARQLPPVPDGAQVGRKHLGVDTGCRRLSNTTAGFAICVNHCLDVKADL
jgi:CO/xanthine dehydrogenase Mo-binding subunit